MLDMVNSAYISRKQRDFMAIIECILYVFSVIKKSTEIYIYHTYCKYQHNAKFRKIKGNGSTFQSEEVKVMLTLSNFSFFYGLISKCNSDKTSGTERPESVGCD